MADAIPGARAVAIVAVARGMSGLVDRVAAFAEANGRFPRERAGGGDERALAREVRRARAFGRMYVCMYACVYVGSVCVGV